MSATQIEVLLPIEIDLAGAPRGKGAGRAGVVGGHARVFKDPKTRSYEDRLTYAAQQVMGEAALIEGPLRVEITARVAIPASMPRRKQALALSGELLPQTKPDCNNYSKSLDALNNVVWKDDKQIVEEFVRKIYSERPGLHIRIGRPLRSLHAD